MTESAHIAVVVPVYNHGLTVGRVVREAARCFRVIVINDGSTDNTSGVLAQAGDVECLAFPVNRGKAAALKAGFARARELGFTHAISIDADGQHPVEALPAFARVATNDPTALVVGVRDLRAARAPIERRISNALSSFWFKFETGLRLADTQCGFRAYPLAGVECLKIKADRYAYELEVLVRAAWAGIPIVPCPVHADYSAPTSRLSHFHPLFDFFRVCGAHSRLAVESVFRARRHQPEVLGN